MSKAYQCDRCGKMFFDKTIKLEKDINITAYGRILDLCCDCARKFNKWWGQEYEMNDCISREAAIACVYEGLSYVEVENKLKALPAVNLAEWIPCKERMPKDYEEVIVYRRKNKGIYLMYHTRYGYWESNDGEGFSFDDSEIAAWMPQPEPYEEDEV